MGLLWEGGRSEQTRARRTYTPEEDALVADRLRVMGYLD
jgi:hypothetical protein